MGPARRAVSASPVSDAPDLPRLHQRVEAAEAGLRNVALSRPGPLALLEAAVVRVATALGATVAAAFVADEASDEWVRCAAWPPDAPPNLVALDAAAVAVAGHGGSVALGPDGPLADTLGAALLLPIDGAARALLALGRPAAWTPAEAAAGERLATLFSTLWSWAETEARFQRTVADLDDALFTFGHDADGRRAYAFVTPQAEALTGLDPDAILAGDADWADLVHPDDRAAWAAHDARLMSGEPSRVDVRLDLADGETVWVSERATPSLDAAGRPVAGGLLQDVTAQKEAEAMLEHARRVAERAAQTRMAFLRLMSHELRTPLGAIRGYAEILAEEGRALTEAPPEFAEFAGTIRESADRALRLVSSLLDLSHLETGGLDLAMAPVDLAGLARVSADRHRSAGSVTMQVDAEEEVVALGDAPRLEGVVDALVSNAFAFTASGEIVVQVATVEGEACLTVRDTGCGMSEDFLEGLFEPFAQEDTRVARGHEGTGLSLAIAHRLVSQMGGRLTVASAQGEGSTFTVALPSAA